MTPVPDAQVWEEIYKLLDPVVILGIVLVTQAWKHRLRKQDRPLFALGLGVLTGVLMTPLSPFDVSLWNVWRRSLAYGGGAVAAYQLRKRFLEPVGLYQPDEDPPAAPPGDAA